MARHSPWLSSTAAIYEELELHEPNSSSRTARDHNFTKSQGQSNAISRVHQLNGTQHNITQIKFDMAAGRHLEKMTS